MKHQNFQPNRRCTRRNRHHRIGHGPRARVASSTSGKYREAASRNTSRIFGTATNAEMRLDWICLAISCALVPVMNTTDTGISGGINSASDCPNRWLRGSRFRMRKRLKRTRVFPVLGDFLSHGLQVRQQIAMRDHDAFGLGRRARCEHDLGHVIHRQVSGRDMRRLRALLDVDDTPHGRRHRRYGNSIADQNHSRLRFFRDALKQSRRRLRIHRDHDDPIEQARPQRGNPSWTVLRPDRRRIALANSRRARNRTRSACAIWATCR